MPTDGASSDLEERKFELDAELRRREMALKEAETKRPGLTAAQATVAGAILALVSGLIGSAITAWSSQKIESGKSLNALQIEELKAKGNLELEKSKQKATESLEQKKFETSLILEAIKTPSRSDAIRNLKFFVAAGFISDPDHKITDLKDENLPSISSPSQESAGRALGATGTVESVSSTRGKVVCTAVAISPQHVVTGSFCVDEKGANADIKFKKGGKVYPLRLVTKQEQAKLALLQVTSSDRLETFLDRSRVRQPSLGERVYLAVAVAAKDTFEIKDAFEIHACEVTKNLPDDSDFEHNCATGPGSAGAVVIAVRDDSLLGIHHSAMKGNDPAKQEIGLAAKIPNALAALAARLPLP